MSTKEEEFTQRELALNQGMRWLLEHEILNSRVVQEAIWWNITMQSKAIADTEPLIDQYKKKMLVYIKLKWWGFLINKKNLSEKIMDVIHQALPQYEVRVVYNREILNKARLLVEKYYGADEID